MNDCKETTKVAKFLLAYAEKRRRKALGASVSPLGSIRIFRYEPSSPGCAEFQTTHEDDISCTCIAARSNLIYGPTTGYRVRHLTPLETYRLMGVDDFHTRRIFRKVKSETKQIQLAGNSIVVDVLESIFIKLFMETENDDNQLSLF